MDVRPCWVDNRKHCSCCCSSGMYVLRRDFGLRGAASHSSYSHPIRVCARAVLWPGPQELVAIPVFCCSCGVCYHAVVEPTSIHYFI